MRARVLGEAGLVRERCEAIRTVVVGDGANIGGSVVSNGGSDGAMVTSTGGANVAGGIIGTNSVFRFGSSETNVTTIGGDVVAVAAGGAHQGQLQPVAVQDVHGRRQRRQQPGGAG